MPQWPEPTMPPPPRRSPAMRRPSATVRAFADASGAERVVLLVDRGEDRDALMVETAPDGALEVTDAGRDADDRARRTARRGPAGAAGRSARRPRPRSRSTPAPGELSRAARRDGQPRRRRARASPAPSAGAAWRRRSSPRATRSCRSRSPRARASRCCSRPATRASSCRWTDVSAERCTWCGADVEAEDGFRAYEVGRQTAGGVLPARARRAVGDPRRVLGAGRRGRGRDRGRRA